MKQKRWHLAASISLTTACRTEVAAAVANVGTVGHIDHGKPKQSTTNVKKLPPTFKPIRRPFYYWMCRPVRHSWPSPRRVKTIKYFKPKGW